MTKRVHTLAPHGSYTNCTHTKNRQAKLAALRIEGQNNSTNLCDREEVVEEILHKRGNCCGARSLGLHVCVPCARAKCNGASAVRAGQAFPAGAVSTDTAFVDSLRDAPQGHR